MFKLNAKFDADSLLYSLSHFECNSYTVHMLTQQCLTPHWLVQWSRHCSHMGIPVHSPWLPGYIDVMQTIVVILTMAGLFPADLVLILHNGWSDSLLLSCIISVFMVLLYHSHQHSNLFSFLSSKKKIIFYSTSLQICSNFLYIIYGKIVKIAQKCCYTILNYFLPILLWTCFRQALYISFQQHSFCQGHHISQLCNKHTISGIHLSKAVHLGVSWENVWGAGATRYK